MTHSVARRACLRQTPPSACPPNGRIKLDLADIAAPAARVIQSSCRRTGQWRFANRAVAAVADGREAAAVGQALEKWWLWWLPCLYLAMVAAVLRNTFLGSSNDTYPGLAAEIVRFWLIVSSFGILILILVSRSLLHVLRRTRRQSRGFEVLNVSK